MCPPGVCEDWFLLLFCGIFRDYFGSLVTFKAFWGIIGAFCDFRRNVGHFLGMILVFWVFLGYIMGIFLVYFWCGVL